VVSVLLVVTRSRRQIFIKCEERNLCCPHFTIGLDVGSLGSGLGVTMKTKSIYLVVNAFSSVVLLLNLVFNMLC
jgi:hypothetical protein